MPIIMSSQMSHPVLYQGSLLRFSFDSDMAKKATIRLNRPMPARQAAIGFKFF